MIWVFSLVSVVVVSLISFVGVTALSLGEARLPRISAVLVSFAVGALLGDAFIHLIPATFRGKHADSLWPSLLVLSGMLLFFVVEKLLRHRHGPIHRQYHPDERGIPELAAINLFGDAIHNFMDGVMIGASYLASPALGFSTTLAVVLHEIPQEFGDFGVLIHSGLSVRRALLFNLASASVAIAGTIVTLIVGSTAGAAATGPLVPVTAGGFIYIASADLIPELQHDRTLRALLLQASLIALGIAVMAMLVMLE